MRKFSLAISSCAIALATAVAGAQAPPQPPADGVAPPPRSDRARADREAGFYRASEILGTTVRGSDGQELGQVQDLLIEQRSQQIRYFILGQGEAVDAQGSLTVVPWMAARPMFQGDQRFIDVKLEQQRFREAPTFTWQEIQSGPAQWSTRVDQFYGVSGRRGGVRGEIERDGDIEIEGRDRPRGDRPRRGELDVERDGDIEVEDRPRAGRPGEPGVNVRPNGEVEVRPNAARGDRGVEGDVEVEGRVGPQGANIEVEGDE